MAKEFAEDIDYKISPGGKYVKANYSRQGQPVWEHDGEGDYAIWFDKTGYLSWMIGEKRFIGTDEGFITSYGNIIPCPTERGTQWWYVKGNETHGVWVKAGADIDVKIN